MYVRLGEWVDCVWVWRRVVGMGDMVVRPLALVSPLVVATQSTLVVSTRRATTCAGRCLRIKRRLELGRTVRMGTSM